MTTQPRMEAQLWWKDFHPGRPGNMKPRRKASCYKHDTYTGKPNAKRTS